jgi:hypothetical protein
MANPANTDVPRELWRVATTLTPEAQDAAVRKCVELGFDPNRGHIQLEETLINLSEARDIIIDAVKKNKVNQLPRKLQLSLLAQLNLASDELTGLTNGKDTVIALEAAVEELTASIWNFQLHNLSGELLGYQTKMNQLKTQETLIRAAANEARGLSDLKKRAAALTDEVSSTAKDIEDRRKAIHETLAAIGDVLKESTETQQKVLAIAALVQQNEIATTQQLSNATQSTANV